MPHVAVTTAGSSTTSAGPCARRRPRSSNATRCAHLERLSAEAANETAQAAAQAHARDVRVRAEGDAAARQLAYDVDLAAEARRLDAYAALSPSLVLGLAAQEAARKITSINHLNISPDLLGSAFGEQLRKSAGE